MGVVALVALIVVTLRMAILSRRDPTRTFRVAMGTSGLQWSENITFGAWMRRFFCLYLAVALFFVGLGCMQLSG
jgi:hypothetical protein